MALLQLSTLPMGIIWHILWLYNPLKWIPLAFQIVIYSAIFLSGLIGIFFIIRILAATLSPNADISASDQKSQAIQETRSKLNDDLEKMLKHVKETQNQSFKLQSENLFLKGKVEELNMHKQTLIEELGGSADNTNIEIRLWQQLTSALDILIEDRMSLLGIIDSAIANQSKSQNKSDYSIDIEKLLKEVSQLKRQSLEQQKQALEQKEQSQTLQKEMTSLQRYFERVNHENKSLKAKDYDYREKIQRLTLKASEKTEEVHSLRQSIKLLDTSEWLTTASSDLQEEIDRLKIYMEDLKASRDELQAKLEVYENPPKSQNQKNQAHTEKDVFLSNDQLTKSANLEALLEQRELENQLLFKQCHEIFHKYRLRKYSSSSQKQWRIVYKEFRHRSADRSMKYQIQVVLRTNSYEELLDFVDLES